MVRSIIPGLLLTGFFALTSNAQQASPPPDWFLKDPQKDHVLGVSAELTYDSLLKGLPSRTIIVAVVDSGIDITHEDLKDVIWTNEDEIPGNGLDDDHNGYIDDFHGWNFIGGIEGNVNEDTYEITREYVRLRNLYGNLEPKKVPKKQKKEYAQYLDVKNKYEKRKEKEVQQYDQFTEQYRLYQTIEKNFKFSVDTFKTILKVEKVTAEAVELFQTSEPILLFSKGLIKRMVKSTAQSDLDSVQSELTETVKYYKSAVEHYSTIVDYGYNENFNSRLIVGDDYMNYSEKYYGNQDVTGPDAQHGTHVAGIIAADRKNTLGIKGIADNVKIMSVRTVPNGDERDKDVANAIRYAVDNGALIINMSFGKSYSPQKKIVDEAVQYAEKKGVLLIHAAGNDSQDIDKQVDYPSRFYLDGREAKNWLEVGASAWGRDEKFVAEFSNYGKKSVDFFAPGQEIYSTTPENHYESLSGTSMACPSAAGVAAMLMSYFPDLTATQIVDILKKSTRKFDGLKVQKPGGGNIEFSQLSNTGGLINAFDAVKLAISLKAKPEIK